MTESTGEPIRFLDEALVAPWVNGVHVGFEAAGLRLTFIVREADDRPGFVAVRQVLVDQTAVPGFLNVMNTQYEMYKLAGEIQPDPGESNP